MSIFTVTEHRGACTDRDHKAGTHEQQPALEVFTPPLSVLILPRLTIPRFTFPRLTGDSVLYE